MERGQLTLAEPQEFAGLSSIQQEPQCARELPRAARLEIDLANRHSLFENGDARGITVGARCLGEGACVSVFVVRVSLVCSGI